MITLYHIETNSAYCAGSLRPDLQPHAQSGSVGSAALLSF